MRRSKSTERDTFEIVLPAASSKITLALTTM